MVWHTAVVVAIVVVDVVVVVVGLIDAATLYERVFHPVGHETSPLPPLFHDGVLRPVVVGSGCDGGVVSNRASSPISSRSFWQSPHAVAGWQARLERIQ